MWFSYSNFFQDLTDSKVLTTPSERTYSLVAADAVMSYPDHSPGIIGSPFC